MYLEIHIFLYICSMPKQLIIKLLLLLFPVLSFAQYQWDVGASLGPTEFLGSLGGGSSTAKPFLGDLNLASTRFGMGGFVRYKASPLISLESQLSLNQLYGSDAYSGDVVRKVRNLSFRNNLIELNVTAEIAFYEIWGLVQSFKTNVDFRAYGIIGVGVYHHNPQAEYEGQWVDLEPLKLNGQNFSLIGMDIPYGLGCHFTINRSQRIGFEIVYRKTFTKNLDDMGDSRYLPNSYFTGPNAAEAIALENRSLVLTSPNSPETQTLLKEYPYLATTYNVGSLRSNAKRDNSFFTPTITYSYAIRGKSSFYRSKYPGLFSKKNKKRKIRAKF